MKGLASSYVPPHEKAGAKERLIKFQMKGKMENHIIVFLEMIEICSTRLSEAYILFSMSVPTHYNQELRKKFSTREPQNLYVVYEFVRTIEFDTQWSEK